MATSRDIKTTLFNAATNNKSQFTLCPNTMRCDLGDNKALEWNHTKVL